MKKLLILLCISSISLAFADEIDLINTKVTCGKYSLTPSSTADEITKNCKMEEMKNKKHLIRDNSTELEFSTDQYQLVKCEFKNNKLDECKVKKK